MGSLFMPDTFVHEPSSPNDIKIVSIAWGWQLGFTVLTGAKAGTQTIKIWRRTGRITGYVAMIWIETLVNTVLGVLCWLYMNEQILPSFALFFGMVTLWCIELHLLIQIIVNRISLLIVSHRRASIIRWGCCAIILTINVGVYCIWIPARLQTSQAFININNIFDRCEKVIYLLLDATLNFYFCYLVKTKLVSAGMTKYMPLYKFNISIVFVSLSMDLLLIGMMSMPNPLLYTQFHPVCYMVKLNIELSMAHMISKIAKVAGQRLREDGDKNNQQDAEMGAEDGSSQEIGDVGNRKTQIGQNKQAKLTGRRTLPNLNSKDKSQTRPDPTRTDLSSQDRVDGRFLNHNVLYHAWVSADAPPPRYDARRNNVTDRLDETEKDRNVIKKHTTVYVAPEEALSNGTFKEHET